MNHYSKVDEVRLVLSGTDYFDELKKLIDSSKETLHLHTYIFEADPTGMQIINAFKKAALRNVSVFILADAFGSNSFPGRLVKELDQTGIKFRFFSPLFSTESIYFGRRLHHKIAVADKTIALVGGLNIADKYNAAGQNAPWLDYAVLIRGKACKYLHNLCESIFNKQTLRIVGSLNGHIQELPHSNNTGLIRFRRNDWIKGKNEIYKSYIEALISAERSIVIVASYFLPGNKFRKLLADAAKRGVDITIILAGTSDISSAKMAEKYLYDFFIRNNIKIYEWKNSVLHAKAMMIDQKWSTVGSYNLNFLSHYISIELNIDIKDPGFISQFSAHIDHIIKQDCLQVNYETTLKKRSLLVRLLMWGVYNFYKLLREVSITRRRHKNEKRT